jgi:hypothetical protein
MFTWNDLNEVKQESNVWQIKFKCTFELGYVRFG